MSSTASAENLKRAIGPGALAIAGVNVMVGSGIFVLPALAADKLGAAAILAYASCGILVFLIALCFAELGSKTTESGGPYKYIEKAFGPYAGFLGGNIYLLGAFASDAAIANAIVDTIQIFFPILRIDFYRLVFQFLLFGGLTWLNIRSVKNGVRLILFTGIGKIVPLILLVLFSAQHIETENLKWTIEPNLQNIGSASLLLFFAFLGFEVPLCNGGEIKNPRRSVPLGLFGGVCLVLLLYLGIQLVTQGVLGSELNGNNDAPLASLAGNLWGRTGMTLIIGVTILSMLGTLSGEILSMPRILFASARAGLMPKALGKVHPRFATPHNSILVYSSIGFLLAASGSFKQLAIIASIALLIVYLGVVLALIRIRNDKPAQPTTGFRIPGGILVPVLAIAAIIWLFFHSQKQEVIALSIAIAGLSVVYFILKITKKKQCEERVRSTK